MRPNVRKIKKVNDTVPDLLMLNMRKGGVGMFNAESAAKDIITTAGLGNNLNKE